MGEIWHNFKNQKPKKSGYYATLAVSCQVFVNTIYFYAESGKFNCGINDDPSLEIKPDFWADIENLLDATWTDTERRWNNG